MVDVGSTSNHQSAEFGKENVRNRKEISTTRKHNHPSTSAMERLTLLSPHNGTQSIQKNNNGNSTTQELRMHPSSPPPVIDALSRKHIFLDRCVAPRSRLFVRRRPRRPPRGTETITGSTKAAAPIPPSLGTLVNELVSLILHCKPKAYLLPFPFLLLVLLLACPRFSLQTVLESSTTSNHPLLRSLIIQSRIT